MSGRIAFTLLKEGQKASNILMMTIIPMILMQWISQGFRFQSRKQSVWLLYLIQCLFFYRNIRHILSFGTKISLRNCVIAIFIIKIMAALVSSRLMIKVNVTNIRDIWTQNCVLNVQTKMSTHRGYLQLVQGTEWNFGTQPCLALCSREYKSPVLKCQTILSAIGVRSEMGP